MVEKDIELDWIIKSGSNCSNCQTLYNHECLCPPLNKWHFLGFCGKWAKIGETEQAYLQQLSQDDAIKLIDEIYERNSH